MRLAPGKSDSNKRVGCHWLSADLPQALTTLLSPAPKRVALIGSGNWASAIALILGKNTKTQPEFEDEVRMWVHEEEIEGRKLTEIINSEHENVKYLPGKKIPENIIADPDVSSATKSADILVICMPHQYLSGLGERIRESVSPGCIAISLVKSIVFDDDGMHQISELLKKDLGGMDVSVLMGANIANEVSETRLDESLRRGV